MAPLTLARVTGREERQSTRTLTIPAHSCRPSGMIHLCCDDVASSRSLLPLQLPLLCAVTIARTVVLARTITSTTLLPYDYKDSSPTAGLANFTVVANDRTKHSHTLSGVCSVSRCGHLCFFWCLASACRRGDSEYMAAGNRATEAPRARAHAHLVFQARALAARAESG